MFAVVSYSGANGDRQPQGDQKESDISDGKKNLNFLLIMNEEP